jgi:Protein of unknown function (DUF1706)
MNKRELLAEMHKERAEWDQVLSEVPEARFTELTMHGGWSVKDTVGHVAYYERWLLHWLEDAVRGRVTVATHRDLLNVDERNGLIYAENRDRLLSDILAEAEQVHDRLCQLVATLPEQDLLDPYRFERYIAPFWGEAQPLWECIAGDSYEYYAEHTANVRVWLAQMTTLRGKSIARSGKSSSIEAGSDAVIRLHASNLVLAGLPEEPIYLHAGEYSPAPR